MIDKKPNTNYPWRVHDSIECVNLDGQTHPPEDTCIVDSEGNEVVGCSEWIRGDENFDRIVLCVNACANLTDEELKEVILIP